MDTSGHGILYKDYILLQPRANKELALFHKDTSGSQPSLKFSRWLKSLPGPTRTPVYVYICICICVYTSLSLSLSRNIHIYIHIYKYIFVYVEYHWAPTPGLPPWRSQMRTVLSRQALSAVLGQEARTTSLREEPGP